jgi:hypothetical protein
MIYMQVDRMVEDPGFDDCAHDRERVNRHDSVEPRMIGHKLRIRLLHNPNHEAVRKLSAHPTYDRLARDDVANMFDE